MGIELREFLNDFGFEIPDNFQPKKGEAIIYLKGTEPIKDKDGYEYLMWGWNKGYIMLFWLS